MKKLFSSLALALVCCLTAVAGELVRDVKVMASDDNVKVQIILSDAKAASGLSARITSVEDRSVLWKGDIGGKGSFSDDTTFVCRISGLSPRLWTPSEPVLYSLEIISPEETVSVKMGFRKFEMKDGNFYLNGKKIFLRGNAINPPKRGIPQALEDSRDFARDYVRFLKGMNINFIRIPINQNWMDVCDEEGMMVFGGRYGRPYGGTEKHAPLDFEAAMKSYKEHYIGEFVNHPSVMIYSLSNEMPTRGKVGEAYMDFLHKAYEELRQWDDTREYIGNAGYGMGRAAAVYDVHRYWGWYYNSFLTFLNLRDMDMWQNEGRVQAVTFSECVGNYTGVDGRFNLCSRTKQPGSQKCWTGHLDEEEQGAAALEYQAFVLGNVTEMFRRFRSQNPRLSGVLPFTIIFHNWDGIGSFAQMNPKPAAYQYGKSYQPVLLSWENWNYNAKAGNRIRVVAHIVNDDDLFRDLAPSRVDWRLESVNRHEICSGRISVPAVPYYGTWSEKIVLDLPAGLSDGIYTLKGAIIGDDGKVISENDTRIRIAGAAPVPSFAKNVVVYGGRTCAALRKAGIKASEYAPGVRLKAGKDILVIGENEADQAAAALAVNFCSQGGHAVCMAQDSGYGWLHGDLKPLSVSNNDPTYLSPSYMYVDGMCINMECPDHPLFKGISREDMFLWADCTDYDETKQGFPRIYPVTAGFSARSLDQGGARILANYGRNLASTAMAEIALGKGSVLVEGFDILDHCGTDPVAERLLVNMISYLCDETVFDSYPEVGSVIEWGSYSSEKGLVTGANNGLVVNPYPVVPLNRIGQYPLKVDSRGYHYVVSYGGWNTRPGVQYLPRGRRPFAPYNFSLGGNDTVAKADEGCGEGYFVARAPKGTTSMVTSFENNCDSDISISVSVNGADTKTVTVPAHGSVTAENALPSDGRIRVSFKGDRRTVILRTEFK